MSIAELVNDFKKNNSMLWVDNDNINLFVSDGFKSQELRDTITKLKSEIIKFLTYNKIFSKEDFQKKTIFASNLNEAILSFAQERLWFIEQFDGGTSAYHIPLIYELSTDTNIQGIKYAIQSVISRHEILRSTIVQKDGELHGVQVVHDAPLTIEEVELTLNDDYKSLLREDINCPFDLNREYPIRAKIYTIQSEESNLEKPSHRTTLLINTHHIASDGWSTDIFQKELFSYYEAFVNRNTDFCLPSLEIQYKDYAMWQRTYLTGETLTNQLNYWKNRLTGYQVLELPTDFARPNQVDYKGAYHEFGFDRTTSQRLRTLAQCHGATLHSAMLSGFSILLGKYTGQDDILVGSPIANRQRRQTEGLIGFFVNMQVNRTLLKSTQSFESLIREVHQGQVEAQLHQDLPFEKLVEGLGVQHDISHQPIFQVFFSLQNFGEQGQAKSYLRSLPVESVYEIEKFDLSVFINDGSDEIKGFISYSTSLFRKNTIERFITHFIHLISQLLEVPEKPYSQISLLHPEEYNQIIYQWNDTNKYYPKDKMVHQLFQEQVERVPDCTALAFGQQRLTYKELNERSNQLARYVRTQYEQRMVQPLVGDILIALYLDRGLEMVIGILAVLKAGGAYVPIDITYPQDRIDYILEDTKVELVLSQKHLLESENRQLPHDKTLYIDLTESIYQGEDGSNLPQHSTVSDLAYVIYTSGTTGKPKGVMVEQGVFLQFIYNFNDFLLDKLNLNKQNILSLTNYVFDIFGLEYALPLITGSTVTISSIDNINEEEILNNQIIQQTPSSLLQIATNYSGKLSDIICLVGGEALLPSVAQKLTQSFKKVFNVYGPAETVIWSSAHEITNPDEPNIGKPLFNEHVYVLDPNKIPVPIGIIGELYIGGAGLARGYLKRPELTQERFVPNPFSTDADRAMGYTRLYKTGDLVRWLPDGNLEFIGRNDGQVKIHGYRIELGEIEHAISHIPGVNQCCVLAKERKTESGTDKYLVAYYVLDRNDDSLDQTTILDRLSQILPEYMLPNVLVEMESFPLTVNGKLDRRVLPDPDFKILPEEYVGPTTEQEFELCAIWQEVLGIDRVGITDDFFRIGGNSILAIQVSHRMSKTLGCEVRVADVFKHRTIKNLFSSVSLLQVDEENINWKF